MGIFDFLKHERPHSAPASQQNSNKGSQPRTVEGAEAPYAARQERQDVPDRRQGPSSQGTGRQPGPNNIVLEYLRRIGRIDQAEKQFRVRIALPGRREPVIIPLYGKNNSYDALNYLLRNNMIRRDCRYMFTDWPGADPAIGHALRNTPACVCELPDRVYHVEEFFMHHPETLYGCPNIFELEGQVPAKTVEVIDYV